MKSFKRREFLSTLGLASLTSLGFTIPDARKKSKPLLSFSTLGCPDWTFNNIVDFAATNNYQGIEVRGILREMDLPKCPVFSSTNIQDTLRLMESKKLKFVNLGSGANLHQADGAGRTKQLDDAKRFIDLAQKLSCPYVRVFPNNLPKEQDRNFTLDQITKGLVELGNYAKGSKVRVLMETHGDVVYVKDIEKIMQNADHPQIGLIWDVLNMWTITKESPTEVYPILKPYIYHTHIKNALLSGDKISYVLLDQGQIPIFEAIDLLRNGGYKGYYSFEWEKMWHPEIEAPEIALADYPKAMARHFNKK